MDVKQLKARIKSIKDVYRQELHKIEKSKKSGSDTEEVYSPKLGLTKQIICQRI
jgi:flagellar biosynthesis/type III secretory pathway chaperone